MSKNLDIVLPSLSMQFNQAWGNGIYILGRTNCYAYALNYPELGWAIPGKLTVEKQSNFEMLLCHAFILRRAVMKDGLEEIDEKDALTGNLHAVALTVTPWTNFHFFRRNSDGLWTHKPGPNAPQNHDASKKEISNPRLAQHSRIFDVKFAGFFAVPESGVQFIHRKSVPEGFVR